jgi:carbon storage regulator
MLVLTRKPGEQIMIGNAIRITVVSVGHGRVKIGVEAPPEVAIDRQEVFDRKRGEQAGPPADAAEPRPLVVDSTAPPRVLYNRIADRLPVTPDGAEHRLAYRPRRGPDPRKPR